MSLIPVNNPVSAVVEFSHIGNVDTVIVAGKVKKRNGKLVGVDFPAFRKRVDAARDALVRARRRADRRLVDRQAVSGREEPAVLRRRAAESARRARSVDGS